MKNLASLKTAFTRSTSRSALILKKHSPEILTGLGVVGIVGTAVLASKATLKLSDVMDEHEDNLHKIDFAQQNAEKYVDYTTDDVLRDKTIVYTRTSVAIAKLYAPAMTAGVATATCFLAAHGIMKKRNVAIAAAYKATEEAFNKYRERVIEAVGADQERDIFNGVREEEIVNEDGSKSIVRVTDGPASPYSFIFDETRSSWNKDRHYNRNFLVCQQNIATDLLRTRGHIFLNEVLDMLGIERTAVGQQVGWVLGNGDDFVDFGLDSFESPEAAAFMAGDEPALWLNFNVDGYVLDLI